MAKNLYNIPTDGCNLEIMRYPFYAEDVSPNEAYRRREYNFNSVVGGTQIVTPGQYVGLDFTITTHIPINPNRPDVHKQIFQEMMSKPVTVTSPEIGGSFQAIVIVKPVHETFNSLKLEISIKEVPDSKSLIPGENFVVPAARKITKKKVTNKNSKKENSSKTTSKKTKTKTKKKTVSKKSKSKKKNK
ncbi:MAG: hypothetical protein IJ258_05735 [Methanobrevibacter sp.]|uniref:hypothetical protein n=1 Tax=Methanobrevibacter sp. TaxID=66852 RepID=UPI0025E69EAA|nr:hypothetical protein [Methanobrevibacter sp.]MBQ8017593.1 hypothetical protein [Methanobrevibacter sp.]